MSETTGAVPSPVSVSIQNGIAHLRLTRAERANAMDAATLQALADAVLEVRSLDGLRVLVISGDGRHFCAGGDLSHVLFDETDPERRLAHINVAYRVTERLLDLDVPVIAAVHGRCAGAALALMLAADLRVAASSTTFSLDFVRLGLLPDMGLCFLLAPAIGTGRALELALTAQVIDAEQGLAWGLVNRVVPDGHELDIALELADRLRRLPPGGLAAARSMVRTAPFQPRDAAFAAEAGRMNDLIPSDDAQRALAAFRSRARPVRDTSTQNMERGDARG
jgi:2-(1,2-epoxy-1,2-dihydrophenyl)acetyl-CoA isomerase